jgi:hypothetical protein
MVDRYAVDLSTSQAIQTYKRIVRAMIDVEKQVDAVDVTHFGEAVRKPERSDPIAGWLFAELHKLVADGALELIEEVFLSGLVWDVLLLWWYRGVPLKLRAGRSAPTRNPTVEKVVGALESKIPAVIHQALDVALDAAQAEIDEFRRPMAYVVRWPAHRGDDAVS